MGRLWKTACSEAKRSRSRGFSHEATARGTKDAVSHRLCRVVENSCLGSKPPRLQRTWADKLSANWSRVSHNPRSSTKAHCDDYGDVPSSTDETTAAGRVLFRSTNGCFFDCQGSDEMARVGTFSINKWVLFRTLFDYSSGTSAL